MVRLAGYAAGLLLALALGAGSALWLAGWLPMGSPVVAAGGISVDGWVTHRAIGSEAANPWLRAYVARRGLLALNRSEAIYYTRYDDSDGAPLNAACAYVVEGLPPDGGWWSLTLYAADDYLAVNGDNAHSVNADGVSTGNDGQWRATVQAEPPGDGSAWISSRSAWRYSLTFRVYQPSPALQDDPSRLAPPRVIRLGCREGDA